MAINPIPSYVPKKLVREVYGSVSKYGSRLTRDQKLLLKREGIDINKNRLSREEFKRGLNALVEGGETWNDNPTALYVRARNYFKSKAAVPKKIDQIRKMAQTRTGRFELEKILYDAKKGSPDYARRIDKMIKAYDPKRISINYGEEEIPPEKMTEEQFRTYSQDKRPAWFMTLKNRTKSKDLKLLVDKILEEKKTRMRAGYFEGRDRSRRPLKDWEVLERIKEGKPIDENEESESVSHLSEQPSNKPQSPPKLPPDLGID